MNVLSETVYDYASQALPKVSGNFLEIGVFNGTGFARIARANPDRICYAVDPFIEDGHTVGSSGQETGSRLNHQKENFLNNTKDLTNVVLHETTSAAFLEQLTEDRCVEMNISVVSIDGDHHYPNVVIDFSIAMKLIGNKPAQIIVDDTNVSRVWQAYSEFVEKFKDRIAESHDVGGTTKAIIIK